MTKVEVFEITYNNDQAVYKEGDSVSGIVKLELTDDIKTKAVRLEICGIALVKWDQSGGDFILDLDNRVKGDCNKEQYFHKRITLLEKGGDGFADGGFLDKDPILKKGSYTFPFDCKLPPELPSSFEGQHGQIRYMAKAYIERQWKTHIVTKKAFTVLSGLDLNFIPEAASRIEICKYKEVGNTCCTSGSVTIDWTVERSGFVPGQDITIHGAVQNESNETVSVSKASLYQVVDYKSKKRKRRERRVIASVDKGETLPGDVTVWQETVHVPPVPPTGLCRCRLIDINYELQFTASFEGKHSPVNYVKEVFIGTVPISRKEMKSCIAGMFNQPYKDSLEYLGPGFLSGQRAISSVSLTKIIAEASITEPKTDPTAPMLPVVVDHRAQNGDVLRTVTPPTPPMVDERPPPFAPALPTSDPNQQISPAQIQQAVVLPPTAPGEMTLARPWEDNAPPSSNLYPSLAACVFGSVSIKDAEDSESVRGDLTYAPLYTYYNTQNRT